MPAVSVQLGGQELGGPLQIAAAVTLLSLAPAILVTLTGFVRIVIVLSFLRQAVGTQGLPPNQVIASLALFLTGVVMMPVFETIRTEAWTPYQQEQIDATEFVRRAYQPLREFMVRQTREKDIALFVDATGAARPAAPADVAPQALVPAFVISELKTAFEMGFIVYVPFLVLDMVVASVLTSMGMLMLPPVLVSLPLKLMLFVLVDGWNVLVGSLVQSFR
jgi:flagellar biosynthetic protein FliP